MNNKDKENNRLNAELNETDCFTDRKTVESKKNVKGEIFLLDIENFGIQLKEGQPALMPCNLPERYKIPGTVITFSGVVKETKLEELWAAQPFVLTKIE